MDDISNIKYSIIIPHYNSPKSLEKLLSSIPIQENIQIIVIDDHSSKDTDELDILIEINKHVSFYQNDGLKNAGTARNIGLKHARGKWVFFADADDFFTAEFINYADKFYHSDYEVVFFSPISIYVSASLISARHLPYEYAVKKYLRNPNHRNELILKYRYCSPWSKMIRRKYLEQHRIDFEAVEVANDVLFSTKLSYYLTSFSLWDQPIYCITEGHGTLSTETNKERFLIRRDVFLRRCTFLIKHLPRSDWKLIKLSGKSQLITSLTKGGGINTLFETYKLLKKHQIRIAALEIYDFTYLCNVLRNKNRRI